MTLSVQATLADVRQRLGRPMAPEEESLAEARLRDASVILESEIPTLNDRLANGALSPDAVVMVHADMVVRVVRNPEGVIQEVDGNYSRTLASASVFAGGLSILPHEYRLLSGYVGGIGSFRPTLEMPVLTPDPWAW